MPLKSLIHILFCGMMIVVSVFPAKAFEIQKITTKGGIKAWLVEDYTVPIISLSLEFTGGASLDPAGKSGLTAMLAAMMDEGAGEYDTASLKAELEERGIELGFSSSQDSLGGGMRILESEKDRAFELMRLILNEPRFEEQSLERLRSAYQANSKREQQNPRFLLGKKMRHLLFAGHPYSRSSKGTEESLKSITQEDIVAHHQALMSRSNLLVGVVGAVNPQELEILLDKTFNALPEFPNLVEVRDVKPEFGSTEHIDFESEQTIVSVALPGLKRNEDGFFAAFLMNHILGGGTFSSRLYDEIREKRGLAYGVGSNMTILDHTAYIGAGFATRSDQAEEALDILLSEIKRLANEGPNMEELERAKKYVLGAYAINNLDTSTKIANVLVGLQSAGLGADYIKNRRKFIGDVSLEDVNLMAKRLLGVKPTIVTIGPPRS